MGNAHGHKYEVWFMICVNVMINVLNIIWLFNNHVNICSVEIKSGGGANFFETTIKYKTSSSYNDLKNLKGGNGKIETEKKSPVLLRLL